MLQLKIPKTEVFDERTNEFIQLKETTLMLEHSLVSISKWEAKTQKPFFGVGKSKQKTQEELLEYMRCMCTTPNVDERVFYCLTSNQLKQIKDYIDSPMTATTISDKQNPPSQRAVTSEVIYAKMIECGIPFECQKWHLNRLLTLIRVCEIRNTPQKKMSKAEIMAQNRALNASRRAAMNSRG